MIIHTNAAVDQPIYCEDRDGTRVVIESTATYRFALKKHREDPDSAAVLTFDTAGGTASITVENGEIDGQVSNYFRLLASQTVVAALTPGMYVADMIVVAPNRQNLFDVMVQISLGISPP
jgi:hypothetical protein